MFDSIYLNLIKEDRYLLILEGLGNTLTIALCAIIIGTVVGALVAFMRLSKVKFLNIIAGVYINVLRGIPLVTQLMIIYFAMLGPFGVDKLVAAIIGFGLNSGAYMAEILRAGIQGIDIGQTEAGRSLGLNKVQTMIKIVLPQAIKNILPTYTNEFIVLIKETSIAGFIAVRDMTKAADIIRSATFDAWVPLLTVAVIYLILTLGLARIFSILERRLAKSDRG